MIPEKIIVSYAGKTNTQLSASRSVFNQLEDFLNAFVTDKESAVPDAGVDAAWHHFILYTKDYQEYCLLNFGSVLHHEPGERAFEIIDDRVIWQDARNVIGDCTCETPPDNPEKELVIA